uniref:Calpastatin n=1 Tax=Anthurium amnicola TaxID=1678845 RepID=A0A1D1YQQ9_9ARAE
MLVGNLAFGSRMVEKVMTARRSAAAAGGRGGGEVKDLKPKQGAPTKQAYGRPSSHSTQAMTTKNMGIRIKPANRHQKQNEGHLESNASSSGSTPRTAPGYEGKEGRNLLIKKGVVRHSWMMC